MESSRTGFHSGSGQGAASSPRVEVRRARIEGASCGSATFTGEWRVHLAAIHECRTHRDLLLYDSFVIGWSSTTDYPKLASLWKSLREVDAQVLLKAPLEWL